MYCILPTLNVFSMNLLPVVKIGLCLLSSNNLQGLYNAATLMLLPNERFIFDSTVLTLFISIIVSQPSNNIRVLLF